MPFFVLLVRLNPHAAHANRVHQDHLVTQDEMLTMVAPVKMVAVVVQASTPKSMTLYCQFHLSVNVNPILDLEGQLVNLDNQAQMVTLVNLETMVPLDHKDHLVLLANLDDLENLANKVALEPLVNFDPPHQLQLDALVNLDAQDPLVLPVDLVILVKMDAPEMQEKVEIKVQEVYQAEMETPVDQVHKDHPDLQALATSAHLLVFHLVIKHAGLDPISQICLQLSLSIKIHRFFVHSLS